MQINLGVLEMPAIKNWSHFLISYIFEIPLINLHNFCNPLSSSPYLFMHLQLHIYLFGHFMALAMLL